MRSRRGLSSVVGAVFAIIALSISVGYVAYSLNILDQYNQAVMSRTQTQLAQQKESYNLVQAPIANGKFNITVANTGPLAVNVTKIWVRNMTAYSAGIDWTRSYNITNTVISPGGIAKNIGQNIALTASPANSYDIRIVTSRGNIDEAYVGSIGSQIVSTQLTSFPQVMAPGYTATVMYTVTNNMSSNTILSNIQPSAVAVSSTGTGSASLVSGPTPTQLTLQPGQSGVFKWVYTVSGVGGDTVTFTTSLQNAASTPSSADTVTLQDVLFASQSKTTESALGLNWSPTPNGILVEHMETAGTPSSSYEIFSGVNDNTGTSLTLKAGNPNPMSTIFYTANSTTQTTTIPAGKWNAVFRYSSVAMPTANLVANPPDMIYFFGSGVQLKDSSLNTDDLTATGSPTYTSSCTRDGSGCYTFSGSSGKYLHANEQSYNDCSYGYCTTAGWFKVSSLPSTTGKEGTIFDVDQGATFDFYKISVLKNGKLRFAYGTDNDGNTDADATICYSAASTYGDGNWHFFVAERDNQGGNNNGVCHLYVDNAAVVTASPTGSPLSSIDDQGNGVYIGRNGTETSAGSSYFAGSIDYIMYWNNYMPTAADVAALYSKNYGTSAHTIHINIDKTDNSGNLITHLNTTNNNFVIPFYDNGYSGASPWGKVNYTIPNLASQTIPATDRLRFNVTSASGHPEALNMTWRIDDKNLVDFYSGYSSFLQIPTPTPGFLSYYTYSIASGSLTYTGSNQGPNAISITAGTRVLFQTTVGGTCNPSSPTSACSFAGVITTVNATGVGDVTNNNVLQDSKLIPLNQHYVIIFTQPNTLPTVYQPASATKVVPGVYKMYISIVGYDDTGASVLRTITVGNVNVVP